MAFRPVVVALGVVAVGAVLLPNTVAAQDTGATITVEQAHPAGSSMHYIVRMVSDDGGDPVNGARVTATPTGPAGAAATDSPVTLTPADDDGRYEGSVEMPESGTWAVTFASTDPAASLEYTQEIPASPVDASDDIADGGSDTSPVVPLVFAGVFLAALAALGVWTLAERRRPAESAGESPG